MGPTALLPSENIVLRIIVLKKPSYSAGFKPANLGSSRKYNNHYTTENDCSRLDLITIIIAVITIIVWSLEIQTV
jgi:hypothetical protein